MNGRIRHRVATAARQRHKSGSTSEPYRSEENRDGEEEGEEEWQEAQAKCSIHEADEPDRSARCRCRLQLNAAHRSDQEDLGLYQAQWPAGQEKPPHDQRGRQAQVRLRRQKPGVDVRDDQAGQPPPQITTFKGRGRPQGCACGDRKSTRLNSSHSQISYAVFCLKKKKKKQDNITVILRAVEAQRY